MNYIAHIKQTFSASDMAVDERMKQVELNFSSLPSKLPKADVFSSLMSSFPRRDAIKVFMKDDSGSNFNFDSSCEMNITEYAAFVDSLFEEDFVDIVIEISKGFEANKLSIYDFGSFCEDILQLKMEDVMLAFSELYSERDFLEFEVFDRDIFFRTGTMTFSSATQRINWDVSSRKEKLEKCKEASYFYHQSLYPLLPEDFYIEVDFENNILSSIFLKISMILSLAYLASTSSIFNNELRIQITGQRNLDYSYILDEINYNKELYKIYCWIFTDGNAVDKALLARNSISAHCKFAEITKLDGKTFVSIQANYNLYIKNNVTQYIELTNSLAEFIQKSTDNVSECLTQLHAGIKTNFIAVISFIFTAVLANIVNGQPLNNILTYDITVILYIVLIGSFAYLAISVSEVRSKKKRMSSQYDSLIDHYKKLLPEDEVNRIADNGNLLEKAKVELRRGVVRWSIVWCALILLAFIIIDVCGDGPKLLAFLFGLMAKS